MGDLVLAGSTSGTTTLTPAAVSGTTTLTLPATTGTVALTASPTFTGQATIPTINLTGGQITFPATQSASADANTLDEYEEGTFTPVVTGTSIVHNIQSGSYVKIGQFVWCQLHVRITSGTPNGQVSGLPFVPDTTASSSVTASIYDPLGSITYAASRTYPSFYANGSSILVGDSGGSAQGASGCTFSSTVRFSCTFTYRATS